RPACAPRRYRRAYGLDRLSRAHPRARERLAPPRRRGRFRALVPLLSVGGLARAAAEDSRFDPPAAGAGMGRTLRQARARARARAARAAAALLRREPERLGRGEDARSL